MTLKRAGYAAWLGGLLIGSAGLALNLVGWKARRLEFDEMPFADEAVRFVENGILPAKGSILSMGAYSPPLSAWIYVPGTLFLDNPSLSGIVGTGLLFVGTVVGISLLIAARFGTACALLAAALFSFSKIGQHFSGFAGAWAFFVVWTAYFAARWATERNGNLFAGAALVWGIGLYNSLVLMPLGVFLLAVWLLFRPPIAARSLALVVLALFIIWLPYLIFDGNRGFENLLAQVVQHSLVADDFERTWCMPALRSTFEAQIGGLDLSGQPRGLPFEGWGGFVKKIGIVAAARMSTIETALTANFEVRLSGPILAEAVKLSFGLAVLSTAGFALRGRMSRLAAISSNVGRFVPSPWVTAIGVAGAIVALALNEWAIERFLSRDGRLWDSEIAVIRQFQVTMALIGLVLIFRRSIRHLIGMAFARFASADVGKDEYLPVLALAFVVPVLVLVLLGAPGRDRYFNLLWPVECILLAVFVMHLLPKLIGMAWVRTAAACLILILLGGKDVANRTWLAYETGYPGSSPPIEQAVEFIGESLRMAGRTEAAIGYHMPFAGYHIAYNIIDPRYKVGAVEDFRLRREFGIENTDRCAEGFSGDDEFLIIAQPPLPETLVAYAPAPERGYETLAEFDGYRVLRRTAGLSN